MTDYSQTTLLGKATEYDSEYNPKLLMGIPREQMRGFLDVDASTVVNEKTGMPFYGMDFWSAFEVSWLDHTGKPKVACAEIIVPADSPFMVESKSLKLYLNSLNMHHFESRSQAQKTIEDDLSACAGRAVMVALHYVNNQSLKRHALTGVHLDRLRTQFTHYSYCPELLEGSADANHIVQESVYTNLFRSNCPVTNQPDWASIEIRYEGAKINHIKLLEYLVSYRNHQGFHEACIERIYVDILNYCGVKKLSVRGHFTRRGGLDINPHRSNFEPIETNHLLYRQ